MSVWPVNLSRLPTLGGMFLCWEEETCTAITQTLGTARKKRRRIRKKRLQFNIDRWETVCRLVLLDFGIRSVVSSGTAFATLWLFMMVSTSVLSNQLCTPCFLFQFLLDNLVTATMVTLDQLNNWIFRFLSRKRNVFFLFLACFFEDSGQLLRQQKERKKNGCDVQWCVLP